MTEHSYTITVTPNLNSALWKIVKYMEYDEERHFLECEPKEQTNHIYHSVMALKACLMPPKEDEESEEGNLVK